MSALNLRGIPRALKAGILRAIYPRGHKEAGALRRMADREAVAVEIIDWQEAELPQLAVLYAFRLLNWMEQEPTGRWPNRQRHVI